MHAHSQQQAGLAGIKKRYFSWFMVQRCFLHVDYCSFLYQI